MSSNTSPSTGVPTSTVSTVNVSNVKVDRSLYSANASLYHVSSDLRDVLGKGSGGLVRRGTVVATGEKVAVKL